MHRHALVDNETFLSLLVVAGEEDGRVRETLRKVLDQPEAQRRAMLRDWAVQLQAGGAPEDFVAAIAALADARVAWRVREALFAGRFNEVWPPPARRQALRRFTGYMLRGRLLLLASAIMALLAIAAGAGLWLPQVGAMERVAAAVTFAVAALLLFSASDM
jgi:hypothetical protein